MTENENYRLIGKRIEQRRKELELTLQEVSLEVGVAASTIQRYEKGRFDKIKLPVIEAIASALKVSPAWLIGDTDDPVDYDDPDIIASIPRSYISACNGDIKRAYKAMQAVYDDTMKEIVKENESGRPAAIAELRRRFGTEHSTLSAYACEDKKKLSVLYYSTLERDAALSMEELIREVEQLSPKQVEDIMYLVKAYLKAKQPIQDIVDTALRPYVEEAKSLQYESALLG